MKLTYSFYGPQNFKIPYMALCSNFSALCEPALKVLFQSWLPDSGLKDEAFSPEYIASIDAHNFYSFPSLCITCVFAVLHI